VVEELLARLNGRKHLVAGNNDPPAPEDSRHGKVANPYAEITVDEVSLVLCHYPFRSWRGMGKGWVNLHGHSHGRLKPLRGNSTSASTSGFPAGYLRADPASAAADGEIVQPRRACRIGVRTRDRREDGCS